MNDNPFSTRYIRPGVLEYIFAPGEDAAALVERLRRADWRGEIIGPHGVGKSTLLATLLPHINAAGRKVISVALHDGERALPPVLRDARAWTAATQIVVDGYEQLSWFSRRKLRWLTNRRSTGLLVTAHRRTGLPTLATLHPTLDGTIAVVERLLGGRNATIHHEQISEAFAAHQGDVRETLFDLYDLYESHCQQDRQDQNKLGSL